MIAVAVIDLLKDAIRNGVRGVTALPSSITAAATPGVPYTDG